jgi:hypothetical protein
MNQKPAIAALCLMFATIAGCSGGGGAWNPADHPNVTVPKCSANSPQHSIHSWSDKGAADWMVAHMPAEGFTNITAPPYKEPYWTVQAVCPIGNAHFNQW